MILYLALSFIGVFVPLLYVIDHLYQYRVHLAESDVRVPPRTPTYFPYLGNTIAYLLDCPSFLKRAIYVEGRPASVRIAFLPGLEVYFFQEPETVKEIWKRSKLLKSVSLRLFFYRYIFCMHPKWLSMFRRDDSGPFPKPYPGTNVAPEHRIHRMLYEGTHNALAGSGYKPTLKRLKGELIRRVHEIELPEGEWTEMGDFRKFILHILGQSFIHAIFGPSLLRLSPSFIDDLDEFNHAVPLLSKGLPKLLIPQAYRARNRVKDHLKKWYAYARENFRESAISEDDDSDPFWGSVWMRNRQQILSSIQDDDALASSDLGVGWGSIVNLVPSTIMALIYILRDQTLLHRVRKEIDDTVGHAPLNEIDVAALSENDLLSSIYAETLRLHVKLNTVVCSQRDHLQLGKWRLPKNGIGLVNSHISHMNEDFWNTKGGTHQLDSFWSERFLTYANDPSSGPILPSRLSQNETTKDADNQAHIFQKPRFTMKGLEGSWVPYGGGHLICPGRFLAKNAIILTCTILLRDMDIELLAGTIKTSSRNFGIGTEQPKDPVEFKIRRRQVPF